MTATKILYKLKDNNLYVNDFGATANFNLVFSPPSDLTDQDINNILACINAEKREPGSTPCSERGLLSYRRLKFIRSNKSSFQIIVPKRDTIIQNAQCIWNILKGKDIKPICVQLIGEHHRNAIDDLAPADRTGDATAAAIKPPDAAGKHVLVFKGTMKEYKTDANHGSSILLGFKSQTDKEGEPYSELKTEIETCIKSLSSITRCGGSTNPRDYRRFIPSLLTAYTDTNDTTNPVDNQTIEQLQTVTVAVADHEAAKIKECGTKIATKKSVVCLEYYGESNSRLHKLLTT